MEKTQNLNLSLHRRNPILGTRSQPGLRGLLEETHQRETSLRPLDQDAQERQLQEPMPIPMDQEQTCVQTAYQIARPILYQVDLTYLFPAILVAPNDLDNLEDTNDVRGENREIHDKEIHESLVIRVRLERLESLEMAVRIEIIATNGIRGKLDQSKRVVWNVHESIKIVGLLRAPVNNLE